MATLLSKYNSKKAAMLQQAQSENMSLEQQMTFQELLYRIEVLEVCQTLCKTAPITTDVKTMCGHYKLLDAYIQCLTAERRFGMPADAGGKERRKTASEALDKTVADCRKRFASFTPTDERQYRSSIGTMVNTVLPVWLQMRNTYVDIKG